MPNPDFVDINQLASTSNRNTIELFTKISPLLIPKYIDSIYNQSNTQNHKLSIQNHHLFHHYRFPTTNRDRLFYHALLRCDVNKVREMIDRNTINNYRTINKISVNEYRGWPGSRGYNVRPIVFFFDEVICPVTAKKLPFHKSLEIFQILVDNGANYWDNYPNYSENESVKAGTKWRFEMSNSYCDKLYMWKLLKIMGVSMKFSKYDCINANTNDNSNSKNNNSKNYYSNSNLEKKIKNMPEIELEITKYLLITPNGTDIAEDFIANRRFKCRAIPINLLRINYTDLEEKLPEFADTVEWLDKSMDATQSISKPGKWFYNTREKDKDNKIVRVYDFTLLNKIKNKRNPYTNEPWYDINLLKKFTISGNLNNNISSNND